MLEQIDSPQLKTLLQAAPVGLLALDHHGHIRWLNDTMANFMHQSPEQVIGKSVTSIGESLRPLFEKNDTLVVPDDVGGAGHWLIRFRQSLPDQAGQLYFFADVSLLQELAEERDELQRRVEELIAVDTVTGLPNRRALFEKLEPEVSRSRRYDNALSVILMQIPDLKEYNEKHGSEMVDKTLLAVSHMLKDQLRWADFIGRLDENEFLLVLPETMLDVTEQLIEKINAHLAELQLDNGAEVPFTIKAVFGKAQWRKGDDVGLLMNRAREALTANSDAA